MKMLVRAVWCRQRDSPSQAHTAPKQQRAVNSASKNGNERTEPFRAVLVRVMKEGGTYDKNT